MSKPNKKLFDWYVTAKDHHLVWLFGLELNAR